MAGCRQQYISSQLGHKVATCVIWVDQCYIFYSYCMQGCFMCVFLVCLKIKERLYAIIVIKSTIHIRVPLVLLQYVMQYVNDVLFKG